MKKIFVLYFICLNFFVLSMELKSACSTEEYSELTTFASYVNYNYVFDYDNYSFSLYIKNLGDKLYVEYNNQKYYPINGEVVIYNLYSGNEVIAKVYANNCEGNSLKSIILNLPYYNTFYNSPKCIGHESLSVCNSEFLNIQLTSELFDKYIENDTPKNVGNNDGEIEEPSDKNNFFDLELIVKIVMVLLGTLIPSVIGSIIYKKIKYKF